MRIIPRLSPVCFRATAALLFASFASTAHAQLPLEFTSIQPGANREVTLKLTAPAGSFFRIDSSPDFLGWSSLYSAKTSAANQFTDAGAPLVDFRFYRAVDLGTANILTGDHLATLEGDVVIRPINHATFVLGWQGKTIYVDPEGGSGRFTGIAKADLILVTHSHRDHFDSATITAIRQTNGIILAPAVVQTALSATLKDFTTVLTNGAVTNVLGLTVEAVPAYNLTTANHPKGTGNGYVLTIGGKRIYVSGDTEDIPEMRALANIDVAFVCMNLPFTMSVNKAASAVREFRPRIVYPYHFSDSNTQQFKTLVGTDLTIEVRLRKWY